MGRPRTGRIPNCSIRIQPEVLNRAREVAFNQKKTLGIWLTEAIDLKIREDSKSVKVVDRR